MELNLLDAVEANKRYIHRPAPLPLWKKAIGVVFAVVFAPIVLLLMCVQLGLDEWDRWLK